MRALLLTALTLLPATALAKTIHSEDTKVLAARVERVMSLVDKPHIKVNLVIEDTGGSTDYSPSKHLIFTIYMRGEMFSTDAAFDLGMEFGVQSARRVSGGVYELTLAPRTSPAKPVLRIDARDAIVAMKRVRCEDFDCDASKDFAATIEVTELGAAKKK